MQPDFHLYGTKALIPFPKQQVLDFSKLHEYANGTVKFDEFYTV